jgi:uncharacterized membrane protein
LSDARNDKVAKDELLKHVESTVQATAMLHAEHDANASRSEEIIDGITHWLGRPLASLVLMAFVLVWVGINLVLPVFGLRGFDGPSFGLLDLVFAIAATLMTIIILASQARAEKLAGRREQLMLQLAFLSDHKQAKIISLLEELRRDDPLIRNRHDHQAEQMTRTTDPSDVLDAIRVSRDELLAQGETNKK